MADDPLVPIISTLTTIYGDLLGDPEAQPLIADHVEAQRALAEAEAALYRYIKEKNR